MIVRSEYLFYPFVASIGVNDEICCIKKKEGKIGKIFLNPQDPLSIQES